MNDYLCNIAARSLSRTETIVPRLAFRYEPLQQGDSLDFGDFSTSESIEWRMPGEQKKGYLIPPFGNEVGAPVPASKRSYRPPAPSVFRYLQLRRDGFKDHHEKMSPRRTGIVNPEAAEALAPSMTGLAGCIP